MRFSLSSSSWFAYISSGLALSLLINDQVSAAPTTSPIITTSSGTYSGSVNQDAGVEFYLGIRYAQPPLGNLRFVAPVPITTPPAGTQDGTNFGDACAQQPLSEAFTLLYGSPSLGADVSEDCLFLNIYRPVATTSEAQYPIMVFLHGGAYSVGAGSQFNGTSMVQKSVSNDSPIIFVTINYRLYVTGFLASSSLAPQDLNAGLLDQNLAFQFIKANAASFGGDPSKITVWGQSAGASSIALHYLFPPANSELPFRAVIEDSGHGSILTVPTLEEYDRTGGPFNLLLNMTGCISNASPIDCLRGVDIDDLLSISAVIDNLTPQAAPGQSTTWLPCLGPEGSLITEYPSQRTLSGNFPRVPIITGTNVDEGTLFAINFLGTDPSLDDQIFNEFIQNRTIVPNNISETTVTTIDALYPVLPPSPTSNSSLFDRINRFVTDFHFVGPRRLFVENAPSSQPIFVYRFEGTVPGSPEELGVFHGAELSYLGILNRTVPSAQEFSDQYVDFYLNFTVNLNPGEAWEEFSANQLILQLLPGNVTLIPDDVDVPQTDFFNEDSILLEFQH